MLRTRNLTWILLVYAGVLCSSATWAQILNSAAKPPVASLPGWVVLVLKPIGLERVRPVTGVVISADGLVIVPLDFAVPGDQIIILDGGTDIAKNGRAATVKTQLGSSGLTVLSAPLLKRAPATLAAAPLKSGDAIRLAAFPPAEQISQGAAPLLVAAEVALAVVPAGQASEAPVMISIVAGKELPNVSGPLLDVCGNLVGWSSSNGVQSMETTASPGYLWQAGLTQALSSVPVNLVTTPCPVLAPALAPAPDAVADSTLAKEAVPAPEAGDGAPAPSGQDQTEATAEPEAAGLDKAGVEGTLVLPGQVNAETGGHSALFWMGLGLLLAILLLAILAALRSWLRTWRGAQGEPVQSLMQDAPPRFFHRGRNTEPPVAESAAEPSDCILEIIGNLPNGTPFQAGCNVRSAAVDAVIGRSGGDISIDSQDVQRAHARISGRAGMLTITDLGSAHGTWINRVPCLKGEIMFIGPDDMIFLGDVSFRIAVRPQ